jgi:Protein of unknown function (DUF3093)
VGSTSVASYSERLRVPGQWWALGVGAVLVGWIVADVAGGPPLSIPVAIVLAVLVFGGLFYYGSAPVRLDADGLIAGRAQLPYWAMGEVRALDPGETHRLLGAEADRRAFHVVRPYVPTGVRIAITDPADPTPYWLVSTRRPESLVRALEAGRQQ